jgi:short-subunit dehydrogenase
LPDHALYGGSKIVPQYLVEALLKELGNRGVTVNSTRAGATVAEAPGSHAIYVSKPETVAALIAKAAKSVSAEMAVN